MKLCRLDAESRLKDGVERQQRLSRWLSLRDAAEIGDETGLETAIRALKLD